MKLRSVIAGRPILIIDFDSNGWMALLGEALRCSVPESARRSLPSASVTYYEEALDALIDDASLSQVVDVLDWIRANSLQVYHGTRLTDEEARLLSGTGCVPCPLAIASGGCDQRSRTFGKPSRRRPHAFGCISSL